MNKKINGILLIVLVVSLSVVYLVNRSYASLESSLIGKSTVNVSRWNILLNNQNITNDEDNQILIDDITWEDNPYVTRGKVAPGSKGTINLEIDASDTDTAVMYMITFIDKTINPEYIVTIKSISCDDTSLVKSDADTYTGVITLDEIASNKKVNLNIEIEWINDESANDEDSLIGLNQKEAVFMEMEMHAVQYNGEVIEPYVEDLP